VGGGRLRRDARKAVGPPSARHSLFTQITDERKDDDTSRRTAATGANQLEASGGVGETVSQRLQNWVDRPERRVSMGLLYNSCNYVVIFLRWLWRNCSISAEDPQKSWRWSVASYPHTY